MGNPPLEVAPGQWKTHVNSYRDQTMHRGKVDPRVSELPQGNELSRDHVNRPSIVNLNQRDMAKQLLTPLRLIAGINFSLKNYSCELFNLTGTVGKVELISTFTTAVCESWNVSEKYTWDNAGDLKQLSMGQTLTKGLFTWTRDNELPRGNDCPGASIILRSHDDLLSRVNFIAPGQVHRHLITTNLSEFI